MSACSLLKPYESELGQGNFIRAEQLSQLEIGQTSDQVIFILGTPLLTGEQREQRWIYPSFEKDTGYSTLTISFDNGLVSDISQK